MLNLAETPLSVDLICSAIILTDQTIIKSSLAQILPVHIISRKTARIHRVKLRHRVYGHDTIAILWV